MRKEVTRVRAVLAHFSISALVIGAFLCITFCFWYPPPYFEADGALHLLLILAMVDVGIGPLATLVVYKPGKPGLKLDMTVIVLAQLAMLVYGAHTIFIARPAYVAFAVDRFNIVSANEVDSALLRYPELGIGFFSGPKWVFAARPEDPKERERILFGVLGGTAGDIETRAELYEPYETHSAQVLQKALPLQRLSEAGTEARHAVEAFLDRQESAPADFRFLPLVGKNKDMAMILDANSGAPLGAIAVNPWVKGG